MTLSVEEEFERDELIRQDGRRNKNKLKVKIRKEA